MVTKYEIMGRKIGSHYLAIGVLSTIFAGVGYATSGSAKKAASQGPPLNASGKDEENFIQQFLQENDKGAAEAKH